MYRKQKKTQKKERKDMSQIQDAKMRKDAEEKQKLWLKKEGFNEAGVTYIVMGDTYSIKDELKEAGFRFNPTLLWHAAEIPAGYEDKVVGVNCKNLAEFSAWGQGYYFQGVAQKIKDYVQPTKPLPASEWLDGDKFSNLAVTLVKKGGFNGRYGWSNVFTFQTEKDNILVWFTTTSHDDVNVGDKLTISGNIKERSEYKGVKNTVVSRVKIQKSTLDHFTDEDAEALGYDSSMFC